MSSQTSEQASQTSPAKGGIVMQILRIALRECGFLRHNAMYLCCMIFFPILVTVFFTTLMNEGQPQRMPIGVVDNDNTSTSRSLIRKLDSFQASKVVAHYPNVNEARKAIQQNKIYAFLYIPKGTTDGLLSARQPKISLYYSQASLTAGNMLYRDLKTVALLGSAGVGQATLRAKGATDKQISTFLQPIAIDLHMIGNPWASYNLYLSTMLIPGILILFMFLITAYSLGTELKFNTSKEWLAMAHDNIIVALSGKLLPQFLIFISIFYAYMYYVFGYLQFPHPGGVGMMLILGFLTVIASIGFGIFAFGLMPSLRMSMSVCSLWAMLGFTTAGATFPVFAMHPIIEGLSVLFPLRHYYMIYQICIFNGFPFVDAWFNFMALFIFAALPFFVLLKIKRAMLEYVYIP
ncbi:MAG: ABC transporter permease [Prevotella sp.]|nr:ABC transporter permease [Prevotella sp.]